MTGFSLWTRRFFPEESPCRANRQRLMASRNPTKVFVLVNRTETHLDFLPGGEATPQGAAWQSAIRHWLSSGMSENLPWRKLFAGLRTPRHDTQIHRSRRPCFLGGADPDLHLDRDSGAETDRLDVTQGYFQSTATSATRPLLSSYLSSPCSRAYSWTHLVTFTSKAQYSAILRSGSKSPDFL